ncbi:hypothetical protein B484DRAFT_457469 [Ochromonadaceae sp. CCMP2298]|nr:hypothetical protein B484DRAFT_457469 [Ochromonadaceae sp. CCMP2298]
MLRPNTFPLFVVLLLMVAVRIARSVWGYLPPVAIFRLIKICLCERWGYRASTKEGVIHPYDLTFHSGDPNRNQEAPLSGGYSKHLRHADDKPVTCFSSLCPCFCQSCYQVPPITESELGARWEVLVVDRFEVKIKTWPQKFELVDGSIKKSGEQKYTYDLICEQHCASFDLESVPAYKMSGITLRKEPFMPIVPDYMAWRATFHERAARTAPTVKGKKPLEDDKEVSKVHKFSTAGQKKDKLLVKGGPPSPKGEKSPFPPSPKPPKSPKPSSSKKGKGFNFKASPVEQPTRTKSEASSRASSRASSASSSSEESSSDSDSDSDDSESDSSDSSEESNHLENIEEEEEN